MKANPIEYSKQSVNKQQGDEGDLLGFSALSNDDSASQKSNEPKRKVEKHQQPVNEQMAHEPKKDDDNIVLLGENTKYPTMKWRFPKTNNCPKVYCNKYFESQYATMQHYSKVHAKSDLLCEECDTLISMTGQHNMINHFQRKHPNSPIPMPTTVASVGSNETVEKATTSKSIDVASQINHIIEMNEQITHHNEDGPSLLKPMEKTKKIDKRRENIMKINNMRRENVSASKFYFDFVVIAKCKLFHWVSI